MEGDQQSRSLEVAEGGTPLLELEDGAEGGYIGPVPNLDQFFARVKDGGPPKKEKGGSDGLSSSSLLQIYEYYLHKGFRSIFLAQLLNLW